MKPIGITTTVPVEVLLAAGYRPVDLNNIFIADPDPERLVRRAEKAGFPLNCCSWIKGIYGVCADRGIDTVLCVTTGDCSNTIMLMEVLKLRGIKTIPFAFPHLPDPRLAQAALEDLAATLGTTLEAAGLARDNLRECRRLAHELDDLTWRDSRVSGWENHLWLVSTSDFNGDPEGYCRDITVLVAECRNRAPYPEGSFRLAYIGVPPVYGRDLYSFIEHHGAHVVFNEVQRQFAMPDPGASLAEQYARYTYPYSIYDRLKDIQEQLVVRRVDGVIHYVQAFCHRAIGDIIFKRGIPLPVLTIEGNNDFCLTSQLRTRLEAYLDMLARRRRKTAAHESAKDLTLTISRCHCEPPQAAKQSLTSKKKIASASPRNDT